MRAPVTGSHLGLLVPLCKGGAMGRSERWAKGLGVFCAAYTTFVAILILTGYGAPTLWWTVVGVALTGAACLGKASRLRRERLRAQDTEDETRRP